MFYSVRQPLFVSRLIALLAVFCLSIWGCTNTAPDNPSNLRFDANLSTQSYKVRWDFAPSVYWYQLLETDLDNPGSPVELPILQPQTLEKAFTGKPANKKYSYQIRLVQLDVNNKLVVVTGWSAAITVDTNALFNPPQPPTTVKATAGTNGQVTVTWAAPSGGIVDNYKVEQRRKTSSWSSWTLLSSAQTNTSYSHSVTRSGLYQYQISACNSLGCSGGASSQEITLAVSENVTTESPPSPAVAPTATPIGDEVGSIGGSFRVSESGSATYTIPLNLVPGTAGVAPQISLAYSSHGGNGLVGLGWSIGGLSAISRCRQTLATESQAIAVNMSSTDRLCLDGQKLVTVSGSYWADGTEYRTEIESYARIVQHVNNGYAYFQVSKKDGSTSYYGVSPDGDITGTDGLQAVRVNGVEQNETQIHNIQTWALRQTQDSVGNRIVFQYSDDTNGHRISTIRYAYAQSSNDNASLTFVYADRDDDLRGYSGGYRYTTNKVLDRIDHYNDGTVVRSYRLTYQSGSDKLKRLQQIEECADSNGSTCLQPTNFDWLTASAGFGAETSDTHMFATEDKVNGQAADIDNDGLTDFVYLAHDIGGGAGQYTLHWAKSDGSALIPQAGSYTLWEQTPSAWFLVDADGDADLDLVYRTSYGWQWAENNGSGFDTAAAFSDMPAAAKNETLVLDINSDGLSDLLYKKDDNTIVSHLMKRHEETVGGNSVWRTSWDVSNETPLWLPATSYLRMNGSWGYFPLWTRFDAFASPIIADFNGDGNVDLATKAANVTYQQCSSVGNCNANWIQSHLLMIFAGRSDGKFDPLAAIPFPTSVNFADLTPEDFKPIDVNGDGLTDLIIKDKGVTNHWIAYVSKGNGDFAQSQDLGTLSNADFVTFNDYNNDGYIDVLYPESGVLKVRLYNSSNETFDSATSTSIGFSSSTQDTYYFMDLNGDGHPSSVRFHVNNAGSESADYADAYIRPSNADLTVEQHPVNVISQIDNGMGNITTIAFAPLTFPPIFGWPDVYTQETDGGNTSWWSGNGTEGWYNEDNDALTKPEKLPVYDILSPTYVVWRVQSSAPQASSTPGSVDNNAQTGVWYTYEGLKSQSGGRGSLGFHRVSSLEDNTGLKTTTTYRQDFPFAGMPEYTEVVQTENSDQVVKSSLNLYTFQNLGSNTAPPYRVVTKKVEDRKYDSDSGAEISLTRTSHTWTTDLSSADAWGNLQRTVVETLDAGGGVLSTVTTRNYFDDTSGFAGTYAAEKGRLSSSTVTHVRPGLPTRTRASQFTYYTSGNVKGLLKDEIIEPSDVLKLKTTYSYDSYGNKNKVAQEGRSGKNASSALQTRYTSYLYDSTGRFVDVTKVKSPSGEFTTQTVNSRNSFGQPTEVVDLDGVITTLEYGNLGRPYYQYSSTGSSTSKAYYLGSGSEDCGNAAISFVEVVTAGGSPNSYTCFDALGRAVRKAVEGFDGNYIFADTEYDVGGRVLHQSEPYFDSASPSWTSNEYNTLGQLQNITHPDGTHTSFTYGFANDQHWKTATNNQGQSKTDYTNLLGQLVKVVDHNESSIEYGYDAVGNLLITAQRADQGNTNADAITLLGYDTFGRKTSMTDPDKHAWTYAYNAFGEQVEQTDALGQKIVTTFDVLGRKTNRKDYNSLSVVKSESTWSYDTGSANQSWPGKPTKINTTNSQGNLAGGTHKVEFSYDEFHRLKDQLIWIEGTLYQTLTTYDEYGRLFQQFDASGNSRGRWNVYNDHGYLSEVREAAIINNQITVYETIEAQTARGQLKTIALSNGFTVDQTYDDETGLVTSIGASMANVEAQYMTYQWDSLGNLIHRWDEHLQEYESFCYDEMNRVVDAGRVMNLDCSALNHTNGEYRYDGMGNILQKTGVDYLYEKTGNAGPHAVTKVGNNSYSYDLNGNVLSDGSRSYAYTSFDQVYRITKGTESVQFWYSADRSRFKQVNANGKMTHYVGDVEFIVQGSQTEVKRQVSSYTLVSEIRNNGITISSVTQHLLRDHLNSVYAVMEGIDVKDYFSFDSWGKRRNAQNWATLWDYTNNSSSILSLTNLTTRGFTGHEMLDTVGIVHMNGRIYDPNIGRFLQADTQIQSPFDTQSYNRYSYVRNNPLALVDPSGYGWLSDRWHDFKDALADNPILGAVISIVAAVVIGPWAVQFFDSVILGGAFTGFIAGGLGTGTLEGAAIGAFSGAAFGALHSFQPDSLLSADGLLKVAAHGAVGGAASVMQGGKFGHGFVSAGITQAASQGNVFDPLDQGGDLTLIRAKNAIAAAAVGGTASRITGGKFSNGAVTGAFSRLLNDLAEQGSERLQKARDLTQQYVKDYGSDAPGFHEYEIGPSFGCFMGDSGCSVESISLIVDSEAVPFKLLPPGDGPTTLLGTNPINHYHSENYSVNDTVDGHWFHPGRVVHTTFESNGAVWFYTRGVGIGPDALANKVIGYTAFSKMHANVKDIISVGIYGEKPQ